MTLAEARALARRLFDAGVAAADPHAAVARALKGSPHPEPTQILALGKAACAMARAALETYPGIPALVVTSAGAAQPVAGAEVLVGEHPIPDGRSDVAGQRLLGSMAAAPGPVLVLISGGGSALTATPVPDVPMADLTRAFEILLGSGLDITQMNRVRQGISAIAGGGLARATSQPVQALALSDVIGDDPRFISSGPCAAPYGPPSEARTLLIEAGLLNDLPETVQEVLRADTVPATPAETQVIGSNRVSVAAMADHVPAATVDPAPLEGDVADAAQKIADAANSAPSGAVFLWGGETTVTLTGTGRGGRNQELALRAAEMIGRPFVLLSGGTDGRDGPTDAAGALVDHGTLGRAKDAGVDPTKALANNDSYPVLAAAGDLLMTGETGTNVADLQVLVTL